MRYPICQTCGIQFAASERNPERCAICEDERQYVGHQGQQWTSLEEYRKTHKNVFTTEEPNLVNIHPQPKAGQRAFVVRTPDGNLLWDCIPPLDDATIDQIKKLGGLKGIAVSHPHYYCTMVEWSYAFGKVPIISISSMPNGLCGPTVWFNSGRAREDAFRWPNAVEHRRTF
jgi:hypothetical protein